MEMVFYLAGAAACVGGFAVLMYQGITYLQYNTWTPYTAFFLVEHGPGAIRDQMSPQITHALQSCPLFVTLIVFGLILLFIGSKVSNRYS